LSVDGQEGLPGIEGGLSDEIIGLRAFARLVGVELGSIQDAIDAGRISAAAVVKTSKGRKLKLAAALADWQAVHQPRSGDLDAELLLADDTDAQFGDMSGDSVQWGRVKTREEAKLAAERRRLLRLEREELEGKLHRAEDVEAVWTDTLSSLRTRLLAIPANAAPVIRALVKPSIADVQAVVESAVRDALTELSGYDESRIRAQRARRTGKAEFGSSA
jgi:phage terminase Nu1 subunit (DNA packaging protein)